MKIYKINGKKIKARIEYANGTSVEKSTSLLLEELLEALSDKEEECNCCGWDDNRYTHEPGCNLKEEPKEEECERCKFDKLPGEYTLPFEYEIKHTCKEVCDHKRYGLKSDRRGVFCVDCDTLLGLSEDEYLNGNKVKQSTSLKEKVKMCNDALPEIFKQSQYPIRHWTLGNFDEANKQSTSLKEEITKMIFWNREAPINTAERILKLIQSHLVKEVEQVEPTQYVKKDSELNQTYTQAKLDIIKIINNLN